MFDGIVKNLKFLGADGQVLTAGKSGKVPRGQIKGSGTGSTPEKFQYFYHPDHLGSTSYVTDASGEVYQHLEYFAFGETFVEEHNNTDRTPYLFNGKELDEETGLYYYGARYYDPRISIFTTIDPMADKYPMMSAYAYVFNNPLRFVDPTGMEGEDPPIHTIKKGESLASIAKQHGTTVEKLQKLNSIKDRDKIYAGKTLKISDSDQRENDQSSNTNTNAAPTQGSSDTSPHYGFGFQLSVGLGLTKGTELSIGGWSGGPGSRGQFFFTIGTAAKKVYLNAGGSAQIELLRSRSGPIDVSGKGKSWGGGLGDFSGAYSQGFDNNGNVSVDVIGGGVGVGFPASIGVGVETKTWTIDYIAPMLITPLMGFGRR